MSNPILTSAQRKQALSDLNALKIRLQTYSFENPKKHGVRFLMALLVPALFIGVTGYNFMTYSLVAGSSVTFIMSAAYYGTLAVNGYLKPQWKDDQISQSDLERVRDFSDVIKELITSSMENAGGKLTYTQLERIAEEADAFLKKDEMRAMVARQLQPARVPTDFSR
ncbi:hypothetical protein WKH15_21505 [Pantoea agglomerans]|uniref:hypothetical protein n=1 Tax=Enterobacter agglomerans TaxID=549 RepID=UPI003C7BD4CC